MSITAAELQGIVFPGLRGSRREVVHLGMAGGGARELELKAEERLRRARARKKSNTWRVKNRDRQREHQRAYRARNREKVNARAKAWTEANAERVKVMKREWNRRYRLKQKAARDAG